MPIYEYYCPKCRVKFEELKSQTRRASASCPDCESNSDLVVSKFNWKFLNPFTKDGEGFTSVHMSKQEATERAKANAGKYD